MVGAITEKKQWLKNHLRNRKTKERNQLVQEKKKPTASKCIFLEKDLSRTAGNKNYPGIGNYWKSVEDVGMLKLDLLFI